MKETISNEKDLANLYYNLYNGCIKFRDENKKPNKDINCEQFFVLYEKLSNKHKDKDNKQNKH